MAPGERFSFLAMRPTLTRDIRSSRNRASSAGVQGRPAGRGPVIYEIPRLRCLSNRNERVAARCGETWTLNRRSTATPKWVIFDRIRLSAPCAVCSDSGRIADIVGGPFRANFGSRLIDAGQNKSRPKAASLTFELASLCVRHIEKGTALFGAPCFAQLLSGRSVSTGNLMSLFRDAFEFRRRPSAHRFHFGKRSARSYDHS